MEIKVLGPGCASCETLDKMVRAVAAKAAPGATVKKVTDILEITRHGVMSTPGLVINGVLVHSGKPLPTEADIKKMIEGAA